MSARSGAARRSTLLLLLLTAAGPAAAQTEGPPAGFTPLFNGVDLTGWHLSRTSHQGTTPDVYVESGAIVLRQHPYGQGGVLLTDRKFRDFELYLEVKPDWGTNGGVFFRSTESGSAYQVEMVGGGAPGTGNLLGEMLRVERGSRAEGLDVVWKEDEWNSLRLRVVGEVPRMTLRVNDVPMWDVVAARNDLIADATEGMIGLQVHWSSTYAPAVGFDMSGSWKPGAAHRYRNIAIRDLGTETPPSPAPPPASRGRSPARLPAMEFVRIEPGRMLVSRFHPTCPSPPAASDTARREREERMDPRAVWTPEDYALCAALVARDALPGFAVTIAEPYHIGRYEVTQEEWEAVMGTNPSVFQGGRVDGGTARHPVENVGWDDIQRFLRRLDELDPAFVYRLPTEFEWEFAARAGASGDLPWSQTRDHAWMGGTDKGTTHPVGQRKPNAWGLHDMLGNVWEWVEDFYNEKTFADPVPPRRGETHVIRGGSFLGDVKNVSYFVRGAGPGNGFDVGLRLVREPR